MNAETTVFVNGKPVRLTAGATVREALGAFDPAAAAQAEAGQAAVTDGVGRALPLSTPLTAGAIVRVVLSAGGHADPEDQSQPSQ